MLNELDLIRDVSERLENAGVEYMLTGSLAMNYYAQPRMTRDIDIVVAVHMKNVGSLLDTLEPEYHVSREAADEAIRSQSMFNAIHEESLIKVDFIVRKREIYRLAEFERRQRISIRDFETWIVSREDLVLSKLEWARESLSELQLGDVKNLLCSGCDWDYLQQWAEELQLTAMLERVSP